MAIGELNCPSLEYVYNMTWAEFRIRLYAYRRQEKNKAFWYRELAWASTLAPHLDHKKLPRTKEQFMPLDGERVNSRRDLMRAKIKQAQEQYLKEQKLKDGSTT
jgi:hypothetical protein